VAGYRRTDKKRNADIRQYLKIFNLGKKITEYQQKYSETYPKNANLPHPSENVQLHPKGRIDRS
jgi:hypothetical protein